MQKKEQMEKQLKQISKFMSLLLRHQPQLIGLTLDENGWANVDDLITKMSEAGTFVDRQLLDLAVSTNDKQRFAFNGDKTMIRTSQGHSIEVALELATSLPPEVLFHGTSTRFLASIMLEGLTKQQRQHVHLSSDEGTAKAVGSRHGKAIVLSIRAAAMHNDGFNFYLSANNVWLVDHVPIKYLSS